MLGVDDPSLADVRADYVVENTDLLEREEVVGQRRVIAAQRRVAAYEARLRRETARERRQAVDAAVRTADRAVLRAIARENREPARRKVTLTAAQAARLEARNRVRNIRAKRRAAARVNAASTASCATASAASRARSSRLADAPGVVGGFRFTYYELFGPAAPDGDRLRRAGDRVGPARHASRTCPTRTASGSSPRRASRRRRSPTSGLPRR